MKIGNSLKREVGEIVRKLGEALISRISPFDRSYNLIKLDVIITSFLSLRLLTLSENLCFQLNFWRFLSFQL